MTIEPVFCIAAAFLSGYHENTHILFMADTYIDLFYDSVEKAQIIIKCCDTI